MGLEVVHDAATLFELLPVSVDDVAVAGDTIGIDWLAEAVNVNHDDHFGASAQHSTSKAQF